MSNEIERTKRVNISGYHNCEPARRSNFETYIRTYPWVINSQENLRFYLNEEIGYWGKEDEVLIFRCAGKPSCTAALKFVTRSWKILRVIYGFWIS